MEIVVRNWLALTVEDQLVDQEGLGLSVGSCLGFLYVNNGVVGSRDPQWLQVALNVLVGLFRRYGLVANVANSKAMKFQLGTL